MKRESFILHTILFALAPFFSAATTLHPNAERTCAPHQYTHNLLAESSLFSYLWSGRAGWTPTQVAQDLGISFCESNQVRTKQRVLLCVQEFILFWIKSQGSSCRRCCSRKLIEAHFAPLRLRCVWILKRPALNCAIPPASSAGQDHLDSERVHSFHNWSATDAATCSTLDLRRLPNCNPWQLKRAMTLIAANKTLNILI